MFDFEYTLRLSLADCQILIDPTVSDIIEEHTQMPEACEDGNSY
ncbi:MAG: hypothetical protein RRY20_04710 [Bilophila sp.]